MTAYALFWELLKHILHGRGSDEVLVSVERGPDVESTYGSARHFSWVGDEDRFCTVEAVGDEP